MTEYDYSPQAYERYLATQNRIANWVDKTEQHRGEFQAANVGLPDLTRSGPGPASHSRLKRSPSPRRQHSGQSQPKHPIHPPPSESDSSSSEGYYEGPWPAQMHQPAPGMVIPPMQQQPLSSPPPMMMAPPFVTSPHRVPHHHRHRSHDRRRSHSHHSPAYYSLASPPLSPGYQYTYPGSNQGYVMPVMPQYGGTQMPVMVCQFSIIIASTIIPFSFFSVLPTIPFIFCHSISDFAKIFVHISLSSLSVEFLSSFSIGTSKCNGVHCTNNSGILSPSSTHLRIPRL